LNNLQGALATFRLLLWKEFIHVFRDKDVLIYTFVVPAVIYPLLLVGGIEMFVMKQEAETKTQTKYGVVAERQGKEKLAVVDRLLAANSHFQKVEGAVSRADLFSGRIALLLDEVPVKAAIGKDEPPKTEVEAMVPASLITNHAVEQVNEELKSDYKTALNKALSDRGLDPTQFKIDKVEQKNLSRGKSEFFSLALGLVLFSLFNVALGGAYPAIAATSEEFERNTIEGMLMLPVNRWFVITAKLVAVTSLALLAGSLNLISMAADSSLAVMGSESVKGIEAFKITLKISPEQMPWVILSYLAIALVYSSLLMLTASFCRTVRASQQWISVPLTVFMLVPLVALLPTIELNNTTALVPLLNNLLVMRSLFNGDAFALPHLIAFLEVPLVVAFTTRVTSSLLFDK
jgi:sodium transport system permease protein